MKNKKTLVIMTILMLSILPVVIAQDLADVSIVGGSIAEQGIIYTEDLSFELGGLVSFINFNILKSLNFLGDSVYDSLETIPVGSYEFYLFPANSEPDFLNLVDGVSFAISNQIVLKSADPNIYETFEVSTQGFLPDYSGLKSLNELVVTDAGSLKIVETGESYGYYIDGVETTLLYAQKFLCELNCPNALDLETYFNLQLTTDYDTLMYLTIPELNGAIVLLVINGADLVGMVFDIDCDGVLDFYGDLSGKKTSSFQGQSLIFSEPDIYDVYAVFEAPIIVATAL